MNTALRAWTALWLLASIGGANAGVESVDGGYSGAWYNPQQSGHGVFLEVLENDQAFAAWFVFDAAGNPFWIVGQGPVEGNTITLDAQALSGAAFPPDFDGSQVERRHWGTLTLEFQSCSEALLSWDSVESPFGTGQLPLNRLTAIQGLPCAQTDRWLADLDVMIDRLLDIHPDPFASIAQPLFEARTDALREQIRTLPEALIPIAFAELMATLGDSHTNVYLPAARLGRLPIAVDRVREGLLITHATAGNEDLLGSLLTAIDGVDVGVIEQRLARLIAHENEAWLEAQIPDHIVIPEALAYLGVAARTDAVSLRVVDVQGDEATVTRSTISAGTPTSLRSVFDTGSHVVPLYLSRDDNYWSVFLSASRTLYVAYRRAQQMAGQTVDEFASELEAFVLSNPVDRLVIDLRLNRGGNSALLQRFIEGIPASPFNDPDTLFVLIGRNTFSSGLLNAFEFMRLTEATLVGQPTGGKPDHFGEVVTRPLPNSGLRVNYATRRFELLGDDSVQSLFPDLVVDDPQRAAYLSGEDPFLDAAISAGSNPN